jgi:hypothetical protein
VDRNLKGSDTVNSTQEEMRMREPIPRSPFSIEISEPIAKKLSQMCAEEKVTMKDLTSELLKRMFLYHRKESLQIAEKLKCRDF